MAEITRDMDRERVAGEVKNRIYEAALVFERLEGLGRVRGNGHHIAQRLAQHAEDLLMERWISLPGENSE